MKIELTKEQKEYVKSNYNSKTNAEMAEYLGLKITTFRTLCYKMGYKRMELEYWTKEQVTYLKKYYKTIGDTEIAANFNKKYHKNKGWNKRHIEKKRRYLGLKRTAEQRKNIQKRNTKNGMFKNCVVKAWKTRGGPAPEGEIRIWSISGVNQKFRKTGNTFVKLARYNWEKFHNKKVRKGYCIVFKDENPMNCEPSNLERITLKENAYRNSSKFHLLPEKTKTVIKLKNKLNKTIYDNRNSQQIRKVS